ncbi:ribose-phosphate pyrophosphokinase [Candidatus Woesebacteria bacterium]|nr:ribose-phosphate pyrophosphokinase [Candidatus Woesebacteria bacterium]
MSSLFFGSSNKDLVKQIGELGIGIGDVNISKFANDEKRVSVGNGSGAAAILQSFSKPVDEHIIEFCLLADALTRAGYSELMGVVPWLGYSKQDKVFLPGEALSAKVIAQIIQTTKIKKLITFDLHNRAITGFFDIPVVELSAKPLFKDYYEKKIGGSKGKYVVVAPDEGAVKASAAIARELGVSIAYMDKRRDLKTGEVSVVGMSGEVVGKNVIIIDDMIVTGSTMMESAEYLKKMGAVSVSVAATHHLYLDGVQDKLEESEIDEVVVSDTVINSKSEIRNMKLKVLSVASLIVDEIEQ